MSKPKNKNEPSRKEIAWTVSARARVQESLLRIYDLESSQKETQPGQDLGRLVGAAFSLWRAAPLVWGNRTADSEISDRQEVLLFLLRDNAINYPQDKASREWMGGYYINNAISRLKSIGHTIAKDLPEPYTKRPALVTETEMDTWDKTLDALNAILDEYQ